MECLACHKENVDGARFCAKCGAPLPVSRTTDADPLIGKTVGGRYKITGVLGEGGMGRVYMAEQSMGTSVRKAAIKTLLAQYAKDPKTVGRFMREVGTVSELEHPNTIKVYDFGQIDESGELYIAMELLTGQALDEVMGAGHPIAPERVDRIIGQVCGSLQEAHDKGIVHRDLKPANIFLTKRAGEQDVVKVLDFGIAKAGHETGKNKTEQKLTQQGTILGTPPYMSPEQFTGKELDGRSDIYSLGILTYEMLTGQLPFEAETGWQWMTQHANAEPKPFEQIPAAANVPHKMRQAVMAALAKDPKDRPQTARDFYEALTLGAARMSALGLGSGGVAGMPPMSSLPRSSLPIATTPSPRGGSTQVGEPIDLPAGALQSPEQMAFGSTEQAAPYSPAGGTQAGLDPVYGGHPAVPTAGGQAFPVPPQHERPSGTPYLIAAAVVAVLGVGAFGAYYVSNRPSEDAESEESPKRSEREAEGDEQKPASPAPDPTPAAPSETAPPEPPPEPIAPATPGLSPQPTPEQWAAQKDDALVNGPALGCKGKHIGEWARVHCSGKNAFGGTPVSVIIDRGSDTSVSTDGGATTLVFPFREGTDVAATFNWTDRTAPFTSVWLKGTPKPPKYGAFGASKPTGSQTAQPASTQPKPPVTTKPPEPVKPPPENDKPPEKQRIPREPPPEKQRIPRDPKPQPTTKPTAKPTAKPDTTGRRIPPGFKLPRRTN